MSRHALLAGRRAPRSTPGWAWHQLWQPAVQMALATALVAWGGQCANAAGAPAAGSAAADDDRAPAEGGSG